MTEAETYEVVAMVKMYWPHSNLGDNPQAVLKLWHSELQPFSSEMVGTAVRSLADEGREFAPPLGVIRQRIRQSMQDPPPSFDDMQAFLSRNVSCLPYGNSNTPDDTVTAIQNFAEIGAHEAVLRFLQERGVYAVRMMPDPTFQPLDPGAEADRRDHSRHYEHVTIPDWRADPTPGLALERAERTLARLANGDLKHLTAGSDEQ